MKRYLNHNLFLWVCIFVFTSCTIASAASENLEELDFRKSRIASSNWGKDYLEDKKTLVWQPETMAYTDVATGHEVWRISSTNGLKNSLPDISWAHFSADGKRFSFGSNRDTSACNSSYETDSNATRQGSVMMMRSDGSYLRPADNAPFEVYVNSRYLHWSPVEPDVYYGFGRNYGWEGLNTDDLYKVTVSDTSISKSLVLDLGTNSRATVKKSMASDGKVIMAQSDGKIFKITLLPSVSISDPDGWEIYRQLDDYWGNTPSDTNYTFHDQFLRGTASDLWLYFIPEGYSSLWRMRLSGSGTDGGPEHTIDNSPPYDWGGEIEPVMTGFGSGGVCDNSDYYSPWNCDGDSDTGPEQFLSHPGLDRWGRLIAGINSQQYKAWGVWDMDSHRWIDAQISAPHYSWYSDWSAWSDYFSATPGAAAKGNDIIYTVAYDGTDTVQVADAHIRESGSTEYNSLTRGTQSPDGTKIVFHSDFLTGIANSWDVFYAVAYFPSPPEITACSAKDGIVTARFEWMLDSTPRGYTKRGWPNEDEDAPPPPRETSKFRLWRSPDKVNWTPAGTVDAEIFARYDFSDGTWLGKDYWTITDTPLRDTGEKDSDGRPVMTSDGTWYYAITSLEWSGLESQTLSNIFSITISNSSGSGSEVQSYPDKPGSDSNFYSSFQASDNLTRYYNIYAKDGETPAPSQTNRIASITTNSSPKYIDWLGNSDGSTKYIITAVDYQGNESEAITPNVQIDAPSSGMYTLTWQLRGDSRLKTPTW